MEMVVVNFVMHIHDVVTRYNNWCVNPTPPNPSLPSTIISLKLFPCLVGRCSMTSHVEVVGRILSL